MTTRRDLPGICVRCDEQTYVWMWTGEPDDPHAVRLSICPSCVEHLRAHPQEHAALVRRARRLSSAP